MYGNTSIKQYKDLLYEEGPFYYIKNMVDIKINKKEYKLMSNYAIWFPEEDGSFKLHALYWKWHRGNRGGGYYESKDFKIPHDKKLTVEFDNTVYDCKDMSPSDVLKMRNHLEIYQVLEDKVV